VGRQIVWREASLARQTEKITYVTIKNRAYHSSVEILSPAAELRDPQLSVLLVLGVYNMLWELRRSNFLDAEVRLRSNLVHAAYHIFYEDRDVACDCKISDQSA
jgi:hypothetical protein